MTVWSSNFYSIGYPLDFSCSDILILLKFKNELLCKCISYVHFINLYIFETNLKRTFFMSFELKIIFILPLRSESKINHTKPYDIIQLFGETFVGYRYRYFEERIVGISRWSIHMQKVTVRNWYKQIQLQPFN